MQLDRQLASDPFPGWIENVPAYHTLTVYYEPLHIIFDVRQYLLDMLDKEKLEDEWRHRKLRVPVIYDSAVAPDLEPAADALGLSVKQLIELHTAGKYHVYMLGFMPGFPYMGNLCEQLQLPRKSVPAAKVAAGTVAIAGHQTGIYPFDSPGGWYSIGKTSIPLFQNGHAFFEPGDEVQFYQVNHF